MKTKFLYTAKGFEKYWSFLEIVEWQLLRKFSFSWGITNSLWISYKLFLLISNDVNLLYGNSYVRLNCLFLVVKTKAWAPFPERKWIKLHDFVKSLTLNLKETSSTWYSEEFESGPFCAWNFSWRSKEVKVWKSKIQIKITQSNNSRSMLHQEKNKWKFYMKFL